jgi:hypothetical protein
MPDDHLGLREAVEDAADEDAPGMRPRLAGVAQLAQTSSWCPCTTTAGTHGDFLVSCDHH